MGHRNARANFQTIIGLLFVIIILFGCGWSLRAGWHVFIVLDKSIAATTIAACATILVAAMSAILANYYTRRRELAQQLYQRKTAIYEEFISFWFRMTMGDKIEGEKPTEEDVQRFFASFTQTLIVWGSDEVVGQWSSMRRQWVSLSEDGKPSTDMLFDLERLFLAIRRDTGHKNKNLKKGDLLGLFVNDVDKYI